MQRCDLCYSMYCHLHSDKKLSCPYIYIAAELWVRMMHNSVARYKLVASSHMLTWVHWENFREKICIFFISKRVFVVKILILRTFWGKWRFFSWNLTMIFVMVALRLTSCLVSGMVVTAGRMQEQTHCMCNTTVNSNNN